MLPIIYINTRLTPFKHVFCLGSIFVHVQANIGAVMKYWCGNDMFVVIKQCIPLPVYLVANWSVNVSMTIFVW